MSSHIEKYKVPLYKVVLVRETSGQNNPAVNSSLDAAPVLKDYFRVLDREHFVVLMLNTKNRLIGLNTVSIGMLSGTLIHPREVFKPAILRNAASVIIAHNHPSGEPEPSMDDKNMTTRLKEAGKILGINILDHIIVGDKKIFSFLESGLL